MVNWNSRGIRKGMVISGNMRVVKVTERGDVRFFHLQFLDLPAGVEVEKFILKVRIDQQDITLAEANQAPSD